ncbi:hypothetical protein GRB29_04820 [Streptococcus pneumoniae]|nr:hypothetical protein [Streptococcus pneumoniae]
MERKRSTSQSKTILKRAKAGSLFLSCRKIILARTARDVLLAVTLTALSSFVATQGVSANNLRDNVPQPSEVSEVMISNSDISKDTVNEQTLPSNGIEVDSIDGEVEEGDLTKIDISESTPEVNDPKLEDDDKSESTDSSLPKPITDEELNHFNLWSSLDYNQGDAIDSRTIAVANFPVSTARRDLPIVISSNVNYLKLQFADTSPKDTSEANATESQSLDIAIFYDVNSQSWMAESLSFDPEIGSRKFLVKSTNKDDGSIILYVPVTKEQITVSDKKLYFVTAYHEEGFSVTVADWIINTPPKIVIEKEIIQANTDILVDLLANLSIFDKEDSGTGGVGALPVKIDLSYKNLETGDVIQLKEEDYKLKFSNSGVYLVMLKVKDSDGRENSAEYRLNIIKSNNPQHHSNPLSEVDGFDNREEKVTAVWVDELVDLSFISEIRLQPLPDIFEHKPKSEESFYHDRTDTLVSERKASSPIDMTPNVKLEMSRLSWIERVITNWLTSKEDQFTSSKQTNQSRLGRDWTISKGKKRHRREFSNLLTQFSLFNRFSDQRVVDKNHHPTSLLLNVIVFFVIIGSSQVCFYFLKKEK